jgi:oxygen-independent coproporphyrinogen-3 oxidase
VVGQDEHKERYHKALCAEIKAGMEQFGRKLPLDTIYFGGGTPSTYPDDLLLDTFGILKEMCEITEKTEITIEVNPGTVRKEQMGLWKSAGINRISIGVQSLNTRVLHSLNRRQTVEDVAFVVQHASDYCDRVSVDLIIGLPGVTEDEWKALVHTVMQWPIQHVSIYFLTIHENTLLYFRVKQKTVSLPCDETVVDMYMWTVETVKQYGFEQYEISNFAKPGCESKHNRAYWERKPYKGFGLGACSFDGHSRTQNDKNFMKYMQSLEMKQDVTVFSETLTQEDIRLEKMMLAIRTMHGLAHSELVKGLNDLQRKQIDETIGILRERDFLIMRDERLVLTPAGLAIEHDIAMRFSRCF